MDLHGKSIIFGPLSPLDIFGISSSESFCLFSFFSVKLKDEIPTDCWRKQREFRGGREKHAQSPALWLSWSLGSKSWAGTFGNALFARTLATSLRNGHQDRELQKRTDVHTFICPYTCVPLKSVNFQEFLLIWYTGFPQFGPVFRGGGEAGKCFRTKTLWTSGLL